ncbi:hypothetical protein KDL01_31170, partial [Actinospica durhamensis]
ATTVPVAAGDAGAWRVQPTATVSISVINKGPDAITLLSGATMTGQGLIRPAALRPSGSALLRPGASGRLTGAITVDCGVGVAAQGSAVASNSAQTTPLRLLVHARTESGTVVAASVAIGATGEAVRERVCQQQGNAVTAAFPEFVDLSRHSVTVTVSVRSRSAQSFSYDLLAGYVIGGETTPGEMSSAWTLTLIDGVPVLDALPADILGLQIPGARLTDIAVSGSTGGTLDPNAGISATFTVRVASCPSQVPASDIDSLQFVVFLDDGGRPAYFQTYHIGLGDLVAEACVLPAPTGG